MSRSKNKVACSASANRSQKKWLKHAHHAERGQVKAVLRVADSETEILPERKEVSDVYDSPKDGKCVSFPGTEYWDEDKYLARK